MISGPSGLRESPSLGLFAGRRRHRCDRDHEADMAGPCVELVNRGIYFFPVSVKQCSISCAHSEVDIEETLSQVEAVLRAVVASSAQKSVRIPI